MHHIVICDLSGSALFFHIFSKTARLSKNITEYKLCVSIFSTTLAETFFFLRTTERVMIENEYWSSCNVLVLLSDFNKLELSQQIFEKYSNIKFYENPSSESRAVAGGWTDRQTEKMKQTVPFRNFANAPMITQNNSFQNCIVNVVRLITKRFCKSVMSFLKWIYGTFPRK